jgi:hypothetical protein
MAVEAQVSRSTRSASYRAGRLLGGGTAGNERLTGVVERKGPPPLSLRLIAPIVLPPAGCDDIGESYQDTNARAGRVISLASALVLGLVLALLTIPQFGPWLAAHHY